MGNVILAALVFTVVGLLALVTFMYSAFAFSTIWEWFLVPEGYPMPSDGMVYGLLLILALLRVKGSKTPKDEEESAWKVFELIVGIWVTISFVLLFGWILK